jgi:thiosulfate/3-mercaptopyruvate sulfurtransferase
MKAAVKDPRIVKLDVRDVDEWIAESSSPYGKDFCPRKGRIPGAVWIEWYRMMKPTPSGPMFMSGMEILAECATVGIRPETPVIVYCFKGLASRMSASTSDHGTNGHATHHCRSKKVCPTRRRH